MDKIGVNINESTGGDHHESSYQTHSKSVETSIDKTLDSIKDCSDGSDEEDYSLLSFFPNYEVYKMKYVRWKQTMWPTTILVSVLILAYSAYLVAVLVIVSKLETENYWCDGDGLLLVLTSLVTVALIYYCLFKKICSRPIEEWFVKHLQKRINSLTEKKVFRYGFCALVLVSVLVFLVVDTADNRARMQSLTGVFMLLLLGFLFSYAPRKIIWRHVIWGFVIQFLIGLLILRWSTGREVFRCLASKVETFLAFTNEGSKFVFGYLAIPEKLFAFYVLPVVLFFSFFVQLLYYYGIMQVVVLKFGWFLQITIGTTACESINAAANIFLGMTEAPLIIKPFIPDMTKSELHAVLTGGFATIAGSTMAAYISFGISATHLLTASVMNAPAALAYAKLFYPETEISKTSIKNLNPPKSVETNALHAALEGVTQALPLVAGIAGNLIAFIAFVAFFNAIFNWSCMLVNVEDGVCTLENVSGYFFMPLAWTLGVAWNECRQVGTLIGIKIIVNEFVAYAALADMVKAGTISVHSEIIATYALCGFSNISSIGIQMGGIGMLAPSRRSDIANVVVRAMIAGSCASFLSGSIAGLLVDASSFESGVNRMITS